ncbi:MAG: hypothetical protein M0P01_00240 [Treponema sp.]|nr:hypothetical protein [Treponema sp.]
MEYKSILIKDTTREEREHIVEDSLNCGDLCSSCCACGGLEIDYQQYIDGKKELNELNAEYHANYMQSGLMEDKNDRSCAM